MSPELDAAGRMQALMGRQSLARSWARFQLEHSLVLGPVSTEPPFRVGTDLTPEGQAAIVQSIRLVLAGNLLGLPAVAAPVGISGGLPQSVQVIGPRLREDLCLYAAEAIERGCGVLTPIEPR
jgi:amidase